MTDKQIDDLDKKIAALEEERQKLLNTKRADVLTDTIATVARYGFTASELGLVATTHYTTKTKPVKAKAPPKYADPANPEKTWAGGKGARPLWVQSHLNAGKSLDDLLIK